MSANWEQSAAFALAKLEAMRLRADAGTSLSRLAIYSTSRPASITALHADEPQAEIVLQRPCGQIIDGALVLLPDSTFGAMIQSDGQPRWAEWFAGDGVLLTRCDVTDSVSGGGIRVIGGKTPDGDTSPMLYAGGLVLLSQVTIT